MQEGLPYFTIPKLWIFQPFGILVAIGVLLGAKLIYRRVERLGLNMDHARGLVAWSVVFGFVGAHVIDVLAYQMDDLKRDPLLLFKVWAGISSYGGFIGGTVGYLLYTMRHKLPIAVWGDTLMIGLVPGFTFGRLGCTIVHDHIGRLTDFPLAMHYTEEVIRTHGYPIEPGLHHNLGLYEFVFCLALTGILFLLVERKPRPPGTVIAVMALLYAPVRYLMDYLRIEATDPRYFGLTFAQWTSGLTLAIGVIMLVRIIMQKPSLEEAVARDAAAAKTSGAGQGSTKGGQANKTGGARNTSKKR